MEPDGEHSSGTVGEDDEIISSKNCEPPAAKTGVHSTVFEVGSHGESSGLKVAEGVKPSAKGEISSSKSGNATADKKIKSKQSSAKTLQQNLAKGFSKGLGFGLRDEAGIVPPLKREFRAADFITNHVEHAELCRQLEIMRNRGIQEGKGTAEQNPFGFINTGHMKGISAQQQVEFKKMFESAKRAYASLKPAEQSRYKMQAMPDPPASASKQKKSEVVSKSTVSTSSTTKSNQCDTKKTAETSVKPPVVSKTEKQKEAVPKETATSSISRETTAGSKPATNTPSKRLNLNESYSKWDKLEVEYYKNLRTI